MSVETQEYLNGTTPGPLTREIPECMRNKYTVVKAIIDFITLIIVGIGRVIQSIFISIIGKKKKDMKGVIAVVTGGGGGLGSLVSLRLARLGCTIVLWDINKQAGNDLIIHHTISEGIPATESNPRPIREARARAASAISEGARKNVSKSKTTASSSLTPTTISEYPAHHSVSDNRDVIETRVSSNKEKDDNWIEVRRRSRKRTNENVTRGTASPTPTSLLVAERRIYLHLYYLQVGTSVAQVLEHLSMRYTVSNSGLKQMFETVY